MSAITVSREGKVSEEELGFGGGLTSPLRIHGPSGLSPWHKEIDC